MTESNILARNPLPGVVYMELDLRNVERNP